ncbi:unnamed protein product [Rotaria sp. Silwood1]|nr:unnamed protein product [Rotaria sp. Silwood1]
MGVIRQFVEKFCVVITIILVYENALIFYQHLFPYWWSHGLYRRFFFHLIIGHWLLINTSMHYYFATTKSPGFVIDLKKELSTQEELGYTKCFKCDVMRPPRAHHCKGDGMLGLYTCAALREHGFERVYCSGTRLQRSTFIEQFGAIPLYSDEILEEETNKIDVVVEVCGVPNVVNDGLRLLKPGGLYLFVGMVHPHSQLNITGEQIIRKCLTIKGIHNYAPRHLDHAVQFLEKTIKKYPYEEVIGPTYDLSDLSRAMQIAIEKRYGRVLVKPNVLTS